MRLRFLLSSGWLAMLHIAVLGAGFVAPYEPARQNRALPYAPPTAIHFTDPEGRWHWRPFVCAQSESLSGAISLDCRNRSPIEFFVTSASYRIGWLTSQVRLFGVKEPAELHVMGTDAYGRDQFSRFIYGGRVSLFGALLASGISLLIAAILGVAAGFYGGFVDGSVMSFTELFLALPWLYALFAVRAFLPLSLRPSSTFWIICAIIGLIGWARPARLLRGVVAGTKNREYVLAARGLGASNGYLLARHVWPETKVVFLTQASLLVPRYMLAEVTLSFFGLGVSEPVASWGNMLSVVQQYSVLVSDWWMFLPALLLVPTAFAYLTLAKDLQTER